MSELQTRNDFQLNKLCCVDDNNHTFNGIETGCERSSCWSHADETNVSPIEKEQIKQLFIRI